ncbi:MAG TPA: MarR family transcriptional regulator [Rubrivivax sp.]|nr:MarR family transcriptional regulator [Burkholderiales bacterium]HNT37681.1 MarR family transcriptional regulator [Rubrivivax sp.]
MPPSAEPESAAHGGAPRGAAAVHRIRPLRAALAERPAELALGPLARLLGYHIAQAAVVVYGSFDQHVRKPFELRKVEFSLLMLLLANGPLTPGQLARTLTLGAPTLSMLLDRLQARALLRRERNPRDGRSQHIVLTPKGRRLAQSSAAAAEPMERELQAQLTPAEHAMLIELLARVAGRPPAR